MGRRKKRKALSPQEANPIVAFIVTMLCIISLVAGQIENILEALQPIHYVIFILAISISLGIWIIINKPSGQNGKSSDRTLVPGLSIHELREMHPVAFEDHIASIFEGAGYTASTTARTGDHGIDIFLTKDGITEVVQCKRFKGSVGEPIVRDLYGSMIHFGATKAYVITTGNILKSARSWVADKPIELIDESNLLKWIDQQDRLRISRIESLANNGNQSSRSEARVSLRTGFGCAVMIVGLVLSCIVFVSVPASRNQTPTRPARTQVAIVQRASATVIPTYTATTRVSSSTPRPTNRSITEDPSSTPRSTIQIASSTPAPMTYTPSPASPSPTATFERIPYEIVSAQKARARNCPLVSCDVIALFDPGERVMMFVQVTGDLIDGTDQWIVFEHDGREMYLHSSLVKQIED